MLPLPLGWRHAPAAETVSSGVAEIDTALDGLPRGRITEVVGPASSGRSTLLDSMLAAATGRGEFCALIDTRDSFDPASAAARGVVMPKLIWVRCGGSAEKSMRAADLLLHNGGFGLVALDLAEVPPATLSRIPPATWFRFRRAVEPTPTLLVVISSRPLTKSCAAVLLETRRRHFSFLKSMDFELIPRKPSRPSIHLCSPAFGHVCSDSQPA